ncbi:FAD/FMN-containing dehydrogenase [Neisseria sp. HSC-16F19]|nr:FAD-binding oxidoreductase [Neisseria sp. HSC-16F19]MCP2039679.1 FAD/FMN-containing dehydrogenase [Neisseria sp. HSC-16F19]
MTALPTLHVTALQNLLSPAEVITDADTMAPFCLDQRRRYRGEVFAVLQPRSVAAVQAAMRYCHQHRIPVTPQGGNTGLCGGATPHASVAGRGIILSLGKLNRVRAFSRADYSLTVDAGMVLADVQRVAAENGCFFPLSLASEGSCQIGGNIACNAGGLNVVRYGPARDLVLGLEVVLADGTLVDQLQPLHKNTSGYDLKHSMIGSEGTLGIITGATLKLFSPPQSVLTAWVGVDSIHAAADLLAAVKNRFGERLSSFELVSAHALKLSADYSNSALPLQAAWHVLLELTDSIVGAELTDPLAEVLDEHGWTEAVIALSESERQQLWRLRENISAAQKRIGTSIKHDIAVPIAAVADCVTDCEAALRQRFAEVETVVFGHLGDGSLHYNVFLPPLFDDAVYAYEDEVNALIYERTLALGGTIAAEHGIGQLKNHWLPRVRSEAELAWMRAGKQQLDPHGILNAGKLLPENGTHGFQAVPSK